MDRENNRAMEEVDEGINNGSLVFESAVVVMGLPEQLSRSLLREVLHTVSISEEKLRIEVLGLVMPQVERRLRIYLSSQETSEIMLRLEKLVLEWGVALQ